MTAKDIATTFLSVGPLSVVDGWYTPNPVQLQLQLSIQHSGVMTARVDWELRCPLNNRLRSVTGNLQLQPLPACIWGTFQVGPSQARTETVSLATVWIQPQDATELVFDLIVHVDGQDTANYRQVVKVPGASVVPTVVAPGILGSWPTSGFRGAWELDPFNRTYDSLLDHLADLGYTPGVACFPMPYDWRMDINRSAEHLARLVGEIRENPGPAWLDRAQVDLVAHSMGGLVSAAYLARYGRESIRRFVCLGTPWLGSPKSYPPAFGEDFRPYQDLQNVIDMLTRRWYGKAKREFRNRFDYLQNSIQSMAQLLPAKPYGAYLKDETGDFPYGRPDTPFFDQLWTSLPAVLKSFDPGDFLCLAGNQVFDESTPHYYKVGPKGQDTWQYGTIEDYDTSCGLGPGDGTVPLDSAVAKPEFSPWATTEVVGPSQTEGPADHDKLPTRLQRRVSRFLTGRTNDVPFFTPHKAWKIWTHKYWFVYMMCPVDLIAVAPDGQKVSFDPTTGRWDVGIQDAHVFDFDSDGHMLVLPLTAGRWALYGAVREAGAYEVVAWHQEDGHEHELFVHRADARVPGATEFIRAVTINDNGSIASVDQQRSLSTRGEGGRSSQSTSSKWIVEARSLPGYDLPGKITGGLRVWNLAALGGQRSQKYRMVPVVLKKVTQVDDQVAIYEIQTDVDLSGAEIRGPRGVRLRLKRKSEID